MLPAFFDGTATKIRSAIISASRISKSPTRGGSATSYAPSYPTAVASEPQPYSARPGHASGIRPRPDIRATGWHSCGRLFYPGWIYLGFSSGEALNVEAGAGTWSKWRERWDRLVEATFVRILTGGEVHRFRAVCCGEQRNGRAAGRTFSTCSPQHIILCQQHIEPSTIAIAAWSRGCGTTSLCRCRERT
jgi:hypothetical protein